MTDREVTRWFGQMIAAERRNAIGVAVAGVLGGLFAYALTFAFT